MSGTVSADEFKQVFERMMEYKMKDAEHAEKEKKLLKDMNLEKQKTKALEESLMNEGLERQKLAENVRKLNAQLNLFKDRHMIQSIIDENIMLKSRADMVSEHKEQLDAMRRNVEHMFQENQILKEENSNLKAGLLSGPGSEAAAAAASPLSDDNKPSVDSSPSRPVITRTFTLEERNEFVDKLLLLGSEKEELLSVNKTLEEKLSEAAKMKTQYEVEAAKMKTQFEVDSRRMLERLTSLQLEREKFLDKLNEKEREAIAASSKVRELEPRIQEIRSFEESKDKLEREISDLKRENFALKQETESLRREKQSSQDEVSILKAKFSQDDKERAKSAARENEESLMQRKAMEDAIAEKLQAQSEYRDAMVQSGRTIRELRDRIQSLVSQVEQAELLKTNAVDEAAAKFSSQRFEFEERIQSLRKELDTLNTTRREMETAESTALRDLESAKQMLNDYAKDIASLKSLVDEQKAHIKDKEDEAVILEKKRNALVKELQVQLKKEALRVKDLDAALKAARDELKQHRHRGSIQRPHVVGPSPQPQSSMVMSLTKRNSTSLAAGKSGPTSPFGFRNLSLSPETRIHSDGGLDNMSPAGDVENIMVSSAPAGRLSLTNQDGEETSSGDFQGMITEKFTRLQKQNFVLQEKIQYLEESIQRLTQELDKKKAVINNLLRRIETGALPASNSTGRQLTTNQALKDELYQKMEIIFHETMTENVNLRDGLDKLGQAFKVLHRENLKLKGEYDGDMTDSKGSSPDGRRMSEYDDNSQLSRSQTITELP
eukprot:TRINITY_DN519_c0_g1_i2.p1 TRINITY_DN519_c0_g1~~TRINITY_DN519_c0_g1_i2.p1  ORF type:complete len:777 (-),score=227.14 TRINITY_DN519_c0_g1_i2:71-2401(-)